MKLSNLARCINYFSYSEKNKPSVQLGFTLPELIIVIGILAVLFGMGIVSLLNVRILATNSSDTVVFISDLKTQQIKSITGDTEGRGIPDIYGIKILPTEYILFHGPTYNPSDDTKVTIPTASGHTLTTTFPNQTILFASSSGELIGFVEGSNTITITKNDTQLIKTITINKYGTITFVN